LFAITGGFLLDGDKFGGSITGAFDALQRLKITLKRGHLRTQSEMKKNETDSVSSQSL
jgi:hypothetical protein